MNKTKQILLLLIASFLITGCTLPFLPKAEYSQELANIFPNKEKTTATYYGLSEYRYHITFKNIKKTNKAITYKIEGYFDDAMSDNPEDRGFTITYTINENSVKETIINNDEFRDKNYNDRLNSIIPNQIILKLPLEVGTSWQQKFEYENKNYTATTKITKIITISKDKKQYITETIANGIEGFFKKQYLEERTYEEGKGLISFVNTVSEYNLDVDREVTQQDYMFGYSQQAINIPK